MYKRQALAKLAAFAASLLVVLTVLYGVNLAYCSASFGLGSLNRTIQRSITIFRMDEKISSPSGIFDSPKMCIRDRSLIRSLPGGRLKTAIAKLAAFAASLLVVLMVLYGVCLLYTSRCV